jgi:hypothetical protein
MLIDLAPMFQTVISQIVFALLGVLSAFLLYYVKLGAEYLKAKIGAGKFAWVKSFIATMVHAYEQNPLFSRLEGEQKKEAILAQITQFCQANKIPVTHEMLDMWLEEAVHLMNAGYVEIVEPLLPAGEAVPAGI